METTSTSLPAPAKPFARNAQFDQQTPEYAPHSNVAQCQRCDITADNPDVGRYHASVSPPRLEGLPSNTNRRTYAVDAGPVPASLGADKRGMA